MTPTVLAQTYRVGTPYVDRGGKGKQAVAEFQGQLMSKRDLSEFFRKEVPRARPGDDVVSKFAGSTYEEGAGVEALLDIEFIMGVAPGVATEFWAWPEQDFCGDLHNYQLHRRAAFTGRASGQLDLVRLARRPEAGRVHAGGRAGRRHELGQARRRRHLSLHLFRGLGVRV